MFLYIIVAFTRNKYILRTFLLVRGNELNNNEWNFILFLQENDNLENSFSFLEGQNEQSFGDQRTITGVFRHYLSELKKLHWKNTSENKNSVVMVMDLERAFDCVDTDILLEEMEHLGIEVNYIDSFKIFSLTETKR